MKILKSIIPFSLALVLLGSCSLSMPMIVTDNAGEKLGTAEYTIILGIFRPMSVDIGIAKAAKKGGITRVATVDQVIESGFFKTTIKTVVTGN